MNYRRILTRKLAMVVPVVVTLVLMIALVATPAGALKMPAQPGGDAVLNSPGPVPAMLNYQGYLTDSSGNPKNDTLAMTFSIYESASGGTAVWTETQPSVSVTDGLFNVLLGSVNPIDVSDLTGESYLGIEVGADGEMTPRQRLTSVAYAIRADKANDADTLDGMDSADFLTPGDVKQLIQDFVVASGQSVTAGDVVGFLDGYVQKGLFPPPPAYSSESVFESDRTASISAAALSSTRFVVAYRDVNDSYRGKAIIGEVSGSTITYGWESVFNSATTDFISVAALSSTQFVVAYRDGGNSSYGTALIGNVVFGNQIEYRLGFKYVFYSDRTESISVAALSSTQFVVAYRNSFDYYGRAVIGNVSEAVFGADLDWVITFGQDWEFNSDYTDYISVAALSPTKFVVAYRDVGESGYGTARIGDVSGNTINHGSEYVFNSDATESISVAALSSTQFVVAYGDGGDHYGTAIIGDVSAVFGGNPDWAITYGSEYVFNSDATESISVAALYSTRFVVTYKDQGNSNYGTAVMGKVSGNTIDYGLESVFNSDYTSLISVAALSPTKFVVAYRGGGGSEYGTAVIGDVDIVGLIGIAMLSGTSPKMVPVIIGGVSDVHSGLTQGVVYYANTAGELTTTATDYKIGLAISKSEILLSMQTP